MRKRVSRVINIHQKLKWPSHISKIDYIKDGDEKTCLHCHSKAIHKMVLGNGNSPHKGNWRIEHKNFALNKSNKTISTTCNLCHQKDFCSSCHKLQMPHPENFAEGHKEIVQKKGKSICYNCHGREFCSTCHE